MAPPLCLFTMLLVSNVQCILTQTLPDHSRFSTPPLLIAFRCACRLFSIDPPTARDLDDALSIQQLPGGNFRVGVHIADVAHFIR